jgi:long-chain acyl-CoA synthetase
MLMERFQPFEFLKNIQKHNVTIFCIVPAMFMAILAMKEYDKFDFSSLRYAVVFGAPSSPVILKRFKNAYPNARLLNGWGMTETAAPNTLSPSDLDLVKSIGRFSPLVEVKIVDEHGKSVEQGNQGELWIKGPVMAGYYNEKELTESVLTNDGWLKTGDIATCDEDGFYYIVGRKKDMIKVAGEIVFPDEVEEKMQRFPAISEVAVIGIEDKMRGEVPKAFIVTRDDQQFDEDKLRLFLKEHLAHFKIPHCFEVVKELPKNRTGKIDKQLLKQRSSS